MYIDELTVDYYKYTHWRLPIIGVLTEDYPYIGVLTEDYPYIGALTEDYPYIGVLSGYNTLMYLL